MKIAEQDQSATKEILKSVQSNFSTWKNILPEEVSMEVISGGITNTLYKMSHQEHDPLLIRVYGENTEILIDRNYEIHILKQLNDYGFGAKVLGKIENGRIESFLEGRCLTVNEMREAKYSKRIAECLAKFHQSKIQVSTLTTGPKEPQLYERLNTWLKLIKKLDIKTDIFKESVIQEEINFLKLISEKLKSPIVFSHNDLLSGNVMINEIENEIKMTFIDFEYSFYSYRGFDIGNHFNEYVGLDSPDYNLYPSLQMRLFFVKNYLIALNQDKMHYCPSQNELNDVICEVEFFSLSSHLFWILWSVIQSRCSKIDFDYLTYAKSRYHEFRKKKHLLFSTNGLLNFLVN